MFCMNLGLLQREANNTDGSGSPDENILVGYPCVECC